MFRNYLKIAWRNFSKNRLVSSINIGGLSIGITAILLIGIYIFNEYSFDRFHKNANSIYRLSTSWYINNAPEGETPEYVAAFAPEAKAAFPEIQSFCRVSTSRPYVVEAGKEKLIIKEMLYADSTFFSMFSFSLLFGNTGEVLKEPYTVVLSKQTAKKLFGTIEATGKMVYINGETQPYKITGIAQDVPFNSGIQYDAVISFSTLYRTYARKEREGWDALGWNGGNRYVSYITLSSVKQQKTLIEKMPAFMWEKVNNKYKDINAKVEVSFQPFKDTHLYFNDSSDALRANLYIFGIVALLILIISCVNYINLSTALSFSRYKEVGVRKVFGASLKQLVKQFVGESLLVVSFALCISLLLTYGLSLLFAEYFSASLKISVENVLLIAATGLLLLFIIGAGAGSNLALYVSSLPVTQVFKGACYGTKSTGIKNILIVFQYAVSLALIAVALMTHYQVRFLKNKSLGFDKEKVLVVSLNSPSSEKQQLFLKGKIEAMASVAAVSGSSQIPYNGITSNGFLPEDRKEYIMPHQLAADKDFFKVFKVKTDHPDAIRNFSERDDVCFVNRALVNMLGWKDPIGRRLRRDTLYTIAGVVDDFNYASLHDKVDPLIITKKMEGKPYANLAVRYTSDNPEKLLSQIKSIWQQNISDAPFDYWFLDNAYNQLYKKEERFQLLFISFSIISVILSLAGVLGLISISLKRKAKEIGIRKVLGATLFDLLKLFSTKYAWIVIISTVIAVPVTWIYMNKWLQNFAYRISVNGWYFITAFIIVLFITVCIISFQTIRAARANPVKSLKTE